MMKNIVDYNDKIKINYNDKIKTISSYFCVSINAAKYMYHRRRRDIPWKKDCDVGYLKWTVQLQNAFIKADNLAVFEWANLKFNTDVHVLMENGIIVNEQPHTIQVNSVQELDKDISEEDEKDGGGWTVVTKNKTYVIQKQLLKNMGFLPKKNPYIHKEKKEFVE
jgi:hypothetical protein